MAPHLHQEPLGSPHSVLWRKAQTVTVVPLTPRLGPHLGSPLMGRILSMATLEHDRFRYERPRLLHLQANPTTRAGALHPCVAKPPARALKSTLTRQRGAPLTRSTDHAGTGCPPGSPTGEADAGHPVCHLNAFLWMALGRRQPRGHLRVPLPAPTRALPLPSRSDPGLSFPSVRGNHCACSVAPRQQRA